MTAMTIEEAAVDLKGLIHDTAPGEEIMITENGLQVAKLVSVAHRYLPRVAGTASHLPHFMADDFDAPLDEMKDYM